MCTERRRVNKSLVYIHILSFSKKKIYYFYTEKGIGLMRHRPLKSTRQWTLSWLFFAKPDIFIDALDKMKLSVCQCSFSSPTHIILYKARNTYKRVKLSVTNAKFSSLKLLTYEPIIYALVGLECQVRALAGYRDH